MQAPQVSSPPFISQYHQVTSQVPSPQSLPQAASNAMPLPQGQNSLDFVNVLAEAISSNRLPAPEPAVFTGDPLRFKDWQLSFRALIDKKNLSKEEKLYYLRKYLSGAAKKAVEGFFLLGSEEAYDTAWQLLEERFGDPFLIGKSFRDKLYAWPKINSKDGYELRDFTDFLKGCLSAMPHVDTLNALNDCNENQKILHKLPDWLVSSWNRKVDKACEERAQYPSFKEFVDFLSEEARIACRSVSSLQAVRSSEGERSRQPRSQPIQARTMATSTTQSDALSCILCKRTGHDLAKCRKFAEKTVQDRVKFVQVEKLCFGCLETGHRSNVCENKSTCETCQKKHPTCLHNDNFKEQQRSRPPRGDNSNDEADATEVDATALATATRIIQEGVNTRTSSIIPVWVSSMKEPDQEVLVYALLDTQSDTTFILDEVAQELNANKTNVKVRVSTISSRSTVVPCQKLTNLQVRGYNLEKRIPLPQVFTQELIPADRSHVPTSETAMRWPHLEQLADKIPPLLNCKIGLLIGYNCQQALLPREILSSDDDQPYAQRTDLGWSIIGGSHPADDCADAVSISHRIIVQQVTPAVQPSVEFKTGVHKVCKDQAGTIKPTDDKQPAVQSKESNRLERPDCPAQQNLPHREKTVGEPGITTELCKVHVNKAKIKTVNSVKNDFTRFSKWSKAARPVARLKKTSREMQGAFTEETLKFKLQMEGTLDKKNSLKVGGRLSRSTFHHNIKRPTSLPPHGEFHREDIHLHKRWRRRHFLASEFWPRWKNEPRCGWHGAKDEATGQ